jgi:hypothetical protein
MNQKKPPQLAVDTCRALQFAALLLLPAYAPTHSKATGPRGWSESTPYLVALGAAPLRFQEEAPLPNFSKRLPVEASPSPSDAVSDSDQSRLGSNSTATTPDRPDVILPAQPPASERNGGTAPFRANNPPPPPPSIIPDDTRPAVRPEDFLPFFQLPGFGPRSSGVRVILPVPMNAPSATTPPPVSSATYNQIP